MITLKKYINYTLSSPLWKAHIDEIIKWNNELVAKFPWLECDKEHKFTWLDNMPPGWYLAFGIQMCEEIQTVLEKYNVVDKYYIVQVKEKFGTLRWYDEAPKECYKEIQDIIHKYDMFSAKTCCECGKPAKWISGGWICPYCDDCRDKIITNGANSEKFTPILDRYKNEKF